MIRFPASRDHTACDHGSWSHEVAPADGFLDQTDLFDVGDGKYKSYRIPCLLALPDDSVLASTSARKSVSDWADVDILLRRSPDGGKTAGAAQVIANFDANTADEPGGDLG